MNSNHENTFISNSFDHEIKAVYAYIFVVCKMTTTCYNRTTGLGISRSGIRTFDLGIYDLIKRNYNHVMKYKYKC